MWPASHVSLHSHNTMWTCAHLSAQRMNCEGKIVQLDVLCTFLFHTSPEGVHLPLYLSQLPPRVHATVSLMSAGIRNRARMNSSSRD